MLSNNVCDSVCNVAACGYDSMSCGCAPNCNFADLGSCKSACLVPDCNYDSYPNYPSCQAVELQILAFYNQLSARNFTGQYTYQYDPSTNCSYVNCLHSLSNCINACGLSSFVETTLGYTIGINPALSCNISEIRNPCLECFSGFYNEYGGCLSSCSPGFAPHPLWPQICYPVPETLGDTEALIYVNVTTAGMADGSVLHPYSSLAVAFSNVYHRYTTILLFPGTHFLDSDFQSVFLQSLSNYNQVLLATPQNLLRLRINAKDCNSDQCERPIVKYQGTSLVYLYFPANTEIANVDFDGNTTIMANCTDLRCFYYSYWTYSALTYYDDRNQVIDVSNIPGGQIPSYNQFSSNSFMNLNSQSLRLENVTISNFRQGFSYLITVYSGSLWLTSVNFYNIFTLNSVIYQLCLGNLTFAYENGKMELINNGFEFTANDQGSFLIIQKVQLSAIRGVQFKFNFQSPTGFTSGDQLISLYSIDNAIIDLCVFEFNVGEIGGIIGITLTLPKAITDFSDVFVFTDYRVAISNCEFRNDTGMIDGIIDITNAESSNVLIANCSFTNELAVNSALITISGASPVSDHSKFGYSRGLNTLTGERIRVNIPPQSVLLQNLTFLNCHMTNGFLKISNLANVEIRSVTITNNTLSSVNYYTNTLQAYTARPDIYMKLSLASAPISLCRDGIALVSCYNVNIVNLFEENIKCANGPVGVNLTALSGDILLTNSSFTDILGNSVYGGVMSVNSSQVSLLRVSLSQGSNIQGSGMIAGFGNASISIIDSHMSFCSSYQGSILTVIIMSSVSIKDSYFGYNEADRSGAVIAIQLVSAAVTYISITGSEFRGNAASMGGVIACLQSDGLLSLKISSSIFQGNTGTYGSALYIPSVQLTGDTLITDSQFSDNQAEVEGVLHLEYISGLFTISNSTFANNSASDSVLIFGNFHTSLALNEIAASNNTGNSMISLPDPTRSKLCTASNVSLDHNSGVAFSLTFANLICSFCTFSSNRSPSGTIMLLSSNSNSTFISSNFSHNQADFKGGIGFATQGSYISITSCKFINNTSGSSAGVLYLESQSTASVSDSIFSYNTAVQKGSVIYLTINSLITLIDSDLSWNSGNDDGVIAAFSSSVILIRMSVSKNTSNGNTPGIILCVSSIFATNSTFSDQIGNTGTFLSLSARSTANVSGCKFTRGTALNYAAGILLLDSSSNVTNCEFSFMTSGSSSSILARINSVLTISNSRFTNQQADIDGAVISTSESDLYISRSSFRVYTQGALILAHASLMVSECDFQCISYLDGFGHIGGAISCISCVTVTVNNSKFLWLSALVGGAVYVSNSNYILISASVFESNSASDSGAIYLNNVNANIISNVFRRNAAKGSSVSLTQRGGAITVLCTSNSNTCSYSLVSNLFESNSAEEKGGGVCWENTEPTFYNNEYLNNTALYGNDIASFPINLTTSNVTTLSDVASGQVSNQALVLELRDHYQNVVVNDNTDIAAITTSQNSTFISGKYQVKAKNGTFIFSDYIVKATPLTYARFNITSTSLQLSQQAFIEFNASMRDCVLGESLVNNECVVCPPDKYSLNPKLDCQKCPEGAECLGNFTMFPKPGYWRSGKYSDVFFPCPNPNACLGSTDFSSPTGVCDIGYEGNKCLQCSSGYSQFSKLYCLPCPNMYVNGLRIIGFLALLLVFGVVIVKSTIKSAHRSKSVLSIHLKILMNYVQLSMLMSALHLTWPNMVLQLFEVHDASGSMVDQIISVDCLLNSQSETTAYFIKLFLMGSAPLVLTALSVIVWMIVALVKQDKAILRNESVSCIVILFFIVHPSIVRMMFNIFNCEEIDPGEYWVVGMNIRCWEGSHLKYTLGFALPCLIIWGIGVPAFCLLILHVNRTHLHDKEMMIRFGYLFNKFAKEKYYWEFLILYRKFVIITVTVFLARVSVFLQSICVFNILLLALIVHYHKQPYTQVHLNQLELRSIFVSWVTVYCGFFYYTVNLSEAAKVLVFLIIIGVNISFIYLWILMTFNVAIRALVTKFVFMRKAFPKLAQETTASIRISLKSKRNYRSTFPFQIYTLKIAQDLENSQIWREDEAIPK